jgi:hypothetical protein
MKSTRKRVIWGIIVVALLVNSFFIIRVILTQEGNDGIPSGLPSSEKALVKGSTDTSINQAYYIKTVGLDNPKGLLFTVNEILKEKQVKDTMGVYREIIDKVFTPAIAEFDSTKPYSPAAINQLIVQGYHFAYAASYYPNEALYLNTLADMHFNNAAKQLEYYQKNNTSLSNQFSFQYMTQRCMEANVGTNVKESSADKFVKTLLEEDYFHLVNTTWNKSSLKLKLLIGLVGFLTILGLINAITFISAKLSIQSKS